MKPVRSPPVAAVVAVDAADTAAAVAIAAAVDVAAAAAAVVAALAGSFPDFRIFFRARAAGLPGSPRRESIDV